MFRNYSLENGVDLLHPIFCIVTTEGLYATLRPWFIRTRILQPFVRTAEILGSQLSSYSYVVKVLQLDGLEKT